MMLAPASAAVGVICPTRTLGGVEQPQEVGPHPAPARARGPLDSTKACRKGCRRPRWPGCRAGRSGRRTRRRARSSVSAVRRVPDHGDPPVLRRPRSAPAVSPRSSSSRSQQGQGDAGRGQLGRRIARPRPPAAAPRSRPPCRASPRRCSRLAQLTEDVRPKAGHRLDGGVHRWSRGTANRGHGDPHSASISANDSSRWSRDISLVSWPPPRSRRPMSISFRLRPGRVEALGPGSSMRHAPDPRWTRSRPRPGGGGRASSSRASGPSPCARRATPVPRATAEFPADPQRRVAAACNRPRHPPPAPWPSKCRPFEADLLAGPMSPSSPAPTPSNRVRCAPRSSTPSAANSETQGSRSRARTWPAPPDSRSTVVIDLAARKGLRLRHHVQPGEQPEFAWSPRHRTARAAKGIEGLVAPRRSATSATGAGWSVNPMAVQSGVLGGLARSG